MICRTQMIWLVQVVMLLHSWLAIVYFKSLGQFHGYVPFHAKSFSDNGLCESHVHVYHLNCVCVCVCVCVSVRVCVFCMCVHVLCMCVCVCACV